MTKPDQPTKAQRRLLQLLLNGWHLRLRGWYPCGWIIEHRTGSIKEIDRRIVKNCEVKGWITDGGRISETGRAILRGKESIDK